MTGKKDSQLNLKLPSEQKAEWEDAVEDHDEASSLSQLIRISVTREINRMRSGTSHGGGGGARGEVDVDMSEVTAGIADLRSMMESMTERIDAMDIMADQRDELQECALEVLRVLPSGSEDEIRSRKVTAGTSRERALTTGGEGNILNVLLEEGYDELLIRDALTRVEQISGVEKIQLDDGQVRYFFREGYGQ